MKLAHYSAKPITGWDSSCCTNRGNTRDYFKPRGLWVSDDSAEQNWQDWCVGEDFGLDRFAYRTEVLLKDQSNILFIRTVEELDKFQDEYKWDILANERYGKGSARYDYCRWSDVVARYDGIIITPYLWQRRLDGPMWYYGWDCASGCVWNGDVVELAESQPFNIEEYAKRTAA